MATILEKDCTTWSVEEAVLSTDEEVRDKLSEELRNTSDRSFLERFLYSDDESFVFSSLENPLVTIDELKEFAKKSEFIRSGVAGNPNLNEEVCEVILEHMTVDDYLFDIITHMELNMGGFLPEKIFIKWLIKFGTEGFYSTEHYFDTLASSNDVESMLTLVARGIEVCAIATNPIWCEEQLDEWARSDDVSLRHGVAMNPKASRKTLEMLAKDSDEYVAEAAEETLEDLY